MAFYTISNLPEYKALAVPQDKQCLIPLHTDLNLFPKLFDSGHIELQFLEFAETTLLPQTFAHTFTRAVRWIERAREGDSMSEQRVHRPGQKRATGCPKLWREGKGDQVSYNVIAEVF